MTFLPVKGGNTWNFLYTKSKSGLRCFPGTFLVKFTWIHASFKHLWLETDRLLSWNRIVLPLVSSCKIDAYVPFVVQIMLRPWVVFFRQIDCKYSTCYCCILNVHYYYIQIIYWNLEIAVTSMCYYFEFLMITFRLGSYCSMLYWSVWWPMKWRSVLWLFLAFKFSW